ncbi:unnamed protein product, partial [Oikopleura dioica]
EAFQSFCSVSNRMRRSSNYWLFTLSRSASAVKMSDQNKLPIPSPVGLAVRSTWAAASICRGDDCNDKFINQKNSDFPEFSEEGSGGGDSSIPTRNTCLVCDGCWNATQAEPEECPENQPFCYTSVSGEWDSTTSIRRRCSDDVLGTQRSDTLTIQEERNICVSGNIPCNGFNMPFNFIEDLPIPSRQDFSRPLGEKEIEFMCGGLEDNCISCYTCTDASDPFNSCTTLPEFNQSKPPTFLRVVYDSDAEEFLENVCSLTVLRSVTGDGLPETMVRRNVVQVKRGQAVPAYLNDQQTSVSGCSGNFCNGNQQGLPNDDTQCFRCQGNSTADPNNPCVTGNLTPFVDPSVKCANSLCKTTIYGDIVRRDCATTEDLFGLDASSAHVTVSSDSATSFVCKTNKCNDIYVDSDHVIRTDADFSNEITFENIKSERVASLESCPDENDCLKCKTCTVRLNEASEDFENCVKGEYTASEWYPRYVNGLPVVCAILKSQQDYSPTFYGQFTYSLERGAMTKVNPDSKFLFKRNFTIGTKQSLRQLQDTVLSCNGDKCNSLSATSLPIRPITRQRADLRAETECYSCNSTEIGPCFYDQSAVSYPASTVTCSDGCQTRLTTNSKKNPLNFFGDSESRVSRSCGDSPLIISTEELWGCIGHDCNNFDDPMIPERQLPNDPIPNNVEDVFCATQECIECQACVHIFKYSEPKQKSYPCGLRKFRKFYEVGGQQIENVCSTDFGIREDGGWSRVGIVSHYVTPKRADTELEEAALLENEEYLISTVLSRASTANGCPICLEGGCENITLFNTCAVENICSSVLTTRLSDGETINLQKCATPQQVTDFNNGRVSIIEQLKRTQCGTDGCNEVGFDPAEWTFETTSELKYPPQMLTRSQSDLVRQHMQGGFPCTDETKCLTCFKCSYVLFEIDGVVTESGRACKGDQGTGSLDMIPVWNNFCWPKVGGIGSNEVGFDGVNGDYDNLECHPEQTMHFMNCGVDSSIDRFSGGGSALLQVNRFYAAFSSSYDFGVPEFGGVYNILRDTTVIGKCAGSNCNNVALDQQLPIIKPGNETYCKSCFYQRADNAYTLYGNYGDEDCIDKPYQVSSARCNDREVCTIKVNQLAHNLNNLNAGLNSRVETISRGCISWNMGIRPEVQSDIKRIAVCLTNECNNFLIDFDAEDLIQLPQAGSWDQPIDPALVPFTCGTFDNECISCLSCESDHADPANADICRYSPELVINGVFRRRYFDPLKSNWVVNQCSTRTATVTGPLGNRINIMDRGSSQNEVGTESESFTSTLCKGHMCNGQEDVESNSSVKMCFLCKNTAECKSGIFDEVAAARQSEFCKSGICETRISGDDVTRRCVDSQVIISYAEDVFGTEINPAPFDVLIEQTLETCSGNSCNSKFVGVDNQIYDETPEFKPMEEPTPVSRAEDCDDRLSPGIDTNLCIKCYNCQNVVDDIDIPENVPCYNELGPEFENYFFKSQAGIPTMCGLRVDKKVSTDGYHYVIKRTAYSGIDPLSVTDEKNHRMEIFRSSNLNCKDELCNSFAINELPVPPIILPRVNSKNGDLQCYNCTYSTDIDGENTDCALEPSSVATCGPAEYCDLRVTETIDFETSSFVASQKYEVERQCKQQIYTGSFYFTSRTIETWACLGDLCNGQTEDAQPPPYPDVPISDERWEEPIPRENVDAICKWVDCLKCLTCNIEYSVNSEKPGQSVLDDQCTTETYRANYLNKKQTSSFWYNQCSVQNGIRVVGKTPIYVLKAGVARTNEPDIPIVNKKSEKSDKTV